MTQTDKDIVARLREIERAVRPGMQPLYLHVLCGDAADEIELLRSTVTDCRIEIERLTAEAKAAEDKGFRRGRESQRITEVQ